MTLDRVFNWEEAAAAHTWVAENRNLGKVVLQIAA
ncbi:MAG: zinc-binding dehydrogenase [Iodobacter sp.]